MNWLFGRVLTARVGEIDYDEAARLVYGAGYPSPGPPVEVHLLERAVRSAAATQSEDGEDDREEETNTDGDRAAPLIEDLEVAEREARLVAWRIRALVEGDAEAGEAPAVVWEEVVPGALAP